MDFIFWVIISILIIFILHNLYDFFKETLTNPITKDLIKKPNETSNDIAKILKEKDQEKFAENSMKDELKSFFQELKDNNSNLQESTSNNTLNFSSI